MNSNNSGRAPIRQAAAGRARIRQAAAGRAQIRQAAAGRAQIHQAAASASLGSGRRLQPLIFPPGSHAVMARGAMDILGANEDPGMSFRRVVDEPHYSLSRVVDVATRMPLAKVQIWVKFGSDGSELPRTLYPDSIWEESPDNEDSTSPIWIKRSEVCFNELSGCFLFEKVVQWEINNGPSLLFVVIRSICLTETYIDKFGIKLYDCGIWHE